MITINGKSYNGNSVSILNGKVFIDGVLQSGDQLSGVVKVEVTGDVTSVNCDANLVVNGNVLEKVNAGGNVTCGNVDGGVDAGGNVTCGGVSGDIDAGGNVTCGSVGGDVDAGGSIIHS